MSDRGLINWRRFLNQKMTWILWFLDAFLSRSLAVFEVTVFQSTSMCQSMVVFNACSFLWNDCVWTVCQNDCLNNSMGSFQLSFRCVIIHLWLHCNEESNGRMCMCQHNCCCRNWKHRSCFQRVRNANFVPQRFRWWLGDYIWFCVGSFVFFF